MKNFVCDVCSKYFKTKKSKVRCESIHSVVTYNELVLEENSKVILNALQEVEDPTDEDKLCKAFASAIKVFGFTISSATAAFIGFMPTKDSCYRNRQSFYNSDEEYNIHCSFNISGKIAEVGEAAFLQKMNLSLDANHCDISFFISQLKQKKVRLIEVITHPYSKGMKLLSVQNYPSENNHHKFSFDIAFPFKNGPKVIEELRLLKSLQEKESSYSKECRKLQSEYSELHIKVRQVADVRYVALSDQMAELGKKREKLSKKINQIEVELSRLNEEFKKQDSHKYLIPDKSFDYDKELLSEMKAKHYRSINNFVNFPKFK